TDQVPAGVTAQTPPGCSQSAGVITCARPDLAPGASTTVVVTGTVSPSFRGTLSNEACATDAEGAEACTTHQAAVVGQNTLEIAKAHEPTPVVAGGPITYTITVTNSAGSLSNATSVVVTDSVPAEVTPEIP